MSALLPNIPSRFGSEFDAVVAKIFPSLATQAYLSKVLSQYDIGFISAEMLIRRLKELINQPSELELFELVRQLIPLRDQMEYSIALPKSDLSRIFRLQLTRTFLQEDFGFKICGGVEQNMGVFINWVEKKSKAWRAGLRKGQQIIRINNLTVNKASHQTIVDYFKISYHLELDVKNVGMVPRSTKNLSLGWAFADEGNRMHADYGIDKELPILFKHLRAEMIGMHIRATDKGITVTSVKKFSDAEEAQIQPGDVIVEIDKNRLDERDFEQCLALLSSDPPFTLKIIREKFEPVVRIASV